MKFSKEAKVGLLGVVTLTIFYLGFNFLKGLDIFSSNDEYYTYYSDVQGLQVSNPVTYNGVTVGRVMKILPQQAENRVMVTMLISKDIELTENTVAVLADISLLGSKAIKIVIREGKIVADNYELKGELEDGLLDSATEQISPTLAKVDSVLINLNEVIKQFSNTGNAMKVLMASATQTSNGVNEVVARNSKNLSMITANAAVLTSNLNRLTIDLDKQIKPILAKASTFTDSLNAMQLGRTVNTLNTSVASLQTILRDINNGEGTLGKLTQDEALYRNLNNTASDLDALISDLKANPKRYVHFSVFGGKDRSKDKKEVQEEVEKVQAQSTLMNN
ncbi:MAG: phospholipid/cholesterol/gamma-HCH transport system substrate-binding protein [Spirosomataceae bacterium]|jgi:phospholipid/cholesterol/gamma-HCH transport system substrate-binding protein